MFKYFILSKYHFTPKSHLMKALHDVKTWDLNLNIKYPLKCKQRLKGSKVSSPSREL